MPDLHYPRAIPGRILVTEWSQTPENRGYFAVSGGVVKITKPQVSGHIGHWRTVVDTP